MVTLQWASFEHGRCRAVRSEEGFTQGCAGAPKRTIHALPSSFFSLLSTLDAHCKVTTHSSLPSPPYSLLWTPTAKCPRTPLYPLLPTLYFFIHVVRISIPCLDSEWWERPLCRVPAV